MTATRDDHRSAQAMSAIWSGLILIMAVAGAIGPAPASAPAAAPAALHAIEADGTQFKVTLADGRVLRSRDLVGATLAVAVEGGVRRLRIEAVETDPGEPARGVPPAPQVFLHTLSVEAADGSWHNVCQPGPDGRRQAFPLAGRARADASIGPAEAGAFEITCTGGAQGKCVRFGYLPWGEGGLDRYNACVRMVRADYCGDGRGTTRDGMNIDIYDDDRVQQADNNPAQEFEAGWTAAGAVCVRHVRVKENVSLAALVEMCPRLKGRVGDICTEEEARKFGAGLFNRSKP
jgi:hypothetical protein